MEIFSNFMDPGGGGEMLGRYVHFLAGITWIGMLYYFNFVQTPFFAKAEAPVKTGMIRGLVPEALWWFRWGAMFTFLTGWGMIAIFMAKGMPHAALYPILSGGLIGSLMWYNVWFVIWPAQQVVIASTNQVATGGQAIPEAANLGKRAGMVSRTNMVLSIPMLFLRGASRNFPVPQGKGWMIAALAVLVMVGLEFNCLSGLDQGRQKWLGNLKQAIHYGLAIAIVFYLLMTFVSAA